MIVLSEHSAFIDKKPISFTKKEALLLGSKSYECFFKRENNNDELCYSINYDKETEKLNFDSSYIIGVDWVIPNSVSIQVLPKLNKDALEIDYLSMLFEALKAPENITHLKGLYSIDFKAPKIPIRQQKDTLTPLLLVEYIQVLNHIVRRGLKKSYYKISSNLNSRVKGKINISSTVKLNHTKGKQQFNHCTYQEFGFNSIENKILKKALLFSQKLLENYEDLNRSYQTQTNYITTAFEKVTGDIAVSDIKNHKKNRLYKAYDKALELAIQILKRYDYNLSNTSALVKETPPFWIDMPKLFELFVFQKLKEVFPLRNEVKHHFKTNYQELDYLIHSQQGKKMVVDAKYKNRYQNGGINMDDARQVSGYARLNSVYKELDLKDSNELIDCLIVYPDQSIPENINFKAAFDNDQQEDRNYKRLYKLGIRLPVISPVN